MPAQKQLKYTAGIVNGSVRESVAFIDQTRKVNFILLSIIELGPVFCFQLRKLRKRDLLLVQMVPIGQLPTKKLAVIGQAGKLWRWKRSHHQWLVQFKWKWQKPWRLSEWIRHSDETIMRAKPRLQARSDVM